MELYEKYHAIKKEAEKIAGHSVKVIAVTKSFPQRIIDSSIAQGIYLLGENKVQELVNKYDNLSNDFRSKVEFHFIGALQSNKSKYLPGITSTVHGLTSTKSINKLNENCNKYVLNKPEYRGISGLIQFNITGEETKSGFLLHDFDMIGEMLQEIKGSLLNICGLMVIGPNTKSENQIADIYKKSNKLRDSFNSKFNLSLSELSMGMSNDYKIACRYGATMIRVGSKLFGERNK